MVFLSLNMLCQKIFWFQSTAGRATDLQLGRMVQQQLSNSCSKTIYTVAEFIMTDLKPCTKPDIPFNFPPSLLPLSFLSPPFFPPFFPPSLLPPSFLPPSSSPSDSLLRCRTCFSDTFIVKAYPPVTVWLSRTMNEPASSCRTNLMASSRVMSGRYQ